MDISTFYAHWNASLSASLQTPKKSCTPCKLGETEAWIGVMSGTSLDGIDVVYCELEVGESPIASGESASPALSYLVAKHTHVRHFEVGYTIDTKQKCLTLQSGDAQSLEDILALEHALSTDYRDAIQQALTRWNISASSLTGIAIHGQTVFHKQDKNGQLHTLQLCNPSILAEAFHIPIVYDFRRRDIAAGGQGAPLVPFFDVLAFADPTKTVVAHNLGGISNVTVLPSCLSPRPLGKRASLLQEGAGDGSRVDANIFAFDTGLANMWIDAVCMTYFDVPYDNGGKLARCGSLIQPLFDEIIAMPFHQDPPPKSTGKDLFSNEVLVCLVNKHTQGRDMPHDVLHTMTHATAYTIAHGYAMHILPKVGNVESIIFSGGGIENEYLMELFQSYWETLCQGSPFPEIKRPEDYEIPNKAKEALAFAYLGWARMHGLPNTLPSCTGSAHFSWCGSIAI